jgi:Zn finger protein HypA/HybF involved in hydrogenase expression
MAGSEKQKGDINRNRQKLIRKTRLPGTDHNQYVWHLACEHCGHEYGANGSDFHLRKCPACQGGAAGLQY